jgi:hypothetical protein
MSDTKTRTTDRKRERESDEARFLDLLAEHDIKCRKIRSAYCFDDFTAHGFNQAYGFVEGIDRERGPRTMTDATTTEQNLLRELKKVKKQPEIHL